MSTVSIAAPPRSAIHRGRRAAKRNGRTRPPVLRALQATAVVERDVLGSAYLEDRSRNAGSIMAHDDIGNVVHRDKVDRLSRA
jgi:hypothetical protein